jgi:hypothetical protein
MEASGEGACLDLAGSEHERLGGERGLRGWCSWPE